MFSRRTWGFVAPFAGLLATLAFTGSASAATNQFSCSASAAHVTALGAVNLEPAVANAANDPCANDSVQTAGISLPPLLVTGAASAVTTSTGVNGSAVGQVANVNLLGIQATVAKSTAAATCTAAGTPTVSSDSTVVGLTIGGTPITFSGQQVPLLGGLGGVATVNLDQTIPTATGVTQRAVDITILGGLDNGVHIVLGEASAGADGNPCTMGPGGPNPPGGPTGPGGPPGGTSPGGPGGGPGGNGGNGFSSACPSGTTLVSGANLCEILAGTERNSSNIVVSGPYSGEISGGTVISQTLAQRLYHSLCLNGAGPKYAVIGNNANNNITVAKVRERVLGLGANDRITVRSGGSTCVDGGTNNDTVKAGNSPVRVYGGDGNDRITMGNGRDIAYGGSGNDVVKAGRGNDSLNGGNGNDTMSAGNGRDRLYGNAGADKLTAGSGTSYEFGAGGNDRLTAKGKTAYVNGGGGRNTAYVLKANMKFARSHGCHTVHRI